MENPLPSPRRKLRVYLDPREQFRSYLERKQRWACLVVHRRGGKTFGCIQDLLNRALTHKREGPALRYAYLAPTRDQTKDIAWGYLKQFTSTMPDIKVHEADLQITLPNKATIRLYSGEAYERLRGIYLDGVVIDEFADIDPQAWFAVIRPCLSDYQGWATMIGTPKGRDNFWRLWESALLDPSWFTLRLKASESGILDPQELADIQRGTPKHIFEQEYETSFDIGRPGAIYSKSISDARAAKRISDDVLWFKEVPVYASFDVGAPLNQRCWIWSLMGDRINFLECLSGGEGCATPADWAGRLMQKQYRYGAVFIPHDAAQVNGGLWQEALKTGGLANVVPVPRQSSVWDGINLALDAFPRVWFNESGCRAGLESLDAYHSKEERDGVTIRAVPNHDWSSHGADAFSLAFQAIKNGLVIDRTAIPRMAMNGGGAPQVVMGYRGE